MVGVISIITLLLMKKPRHGKAGILPRTTQLQVAEVGFEPKTPSVHAPHHSCSLLTRAL